MSQRIAAAAGTDAGPFATIVGVRLKGHLLDGAEFETGTFTVAVDVFNDHVPRLLLPARRALRGRLPERRPDREHRLHRGSGRAAVAQAPP